MDEIKIRSFAFFKCSCGKEWGYAHNFDTTGDEIPLKTHSIHKCKSVDIYAYNKSTKRHFIKHETNRTPSNKTEY